MRFSRWQLLGIGTTIGTIIGFIIFIVSIWLGTWLGLCTLCTSAEGAVIEIPTAGEVEHIRAEDRPAQVTWEWGTPGLRLLDDGRIEITERLLFSVKRWAGESVVLLPQFPDYAPFMPVEMQVVTADRGGIQVIYTNRFHDEPLSPYAWVYGFGSIEIGASDAPIWFAYGDQDEPGYWTTDRPIERYEYGVICRAFETLWNGWPPSLLPMPAGAIEASSPVFATLDGDLRWAIGDGWFELALDCEAWTAIGGVPGEYTCTCGGVEYGGRLDLRYVNEPAPQNAPEENNGSGDE